MAGTFDPYHVWLGIPPSQQPVNHYRLLGVELLESDLTVIEHAADRQMAHIRQFQIGKHRDESQRLLNELSLARVCLLNAESKARYDQNLAASIAPSSPLEEENFLDNSPVRSRGGVSDRHRRNQPIAAPGHPRRTSLNSRHAAMNSRSAKAVEFAIEVAPGSNRPNAAVRGSRGQAGRRTKAIIGAAIVGVIVVAAGVGVWLASEGDSDERSSRQKVVKSAPPVEEMPLLEEIGDQSAKQEQPWDWLVDAEPPEGFRNGALRFQLEKSPQGMKIDARKGRLTWLPGRDESRGPHEVVVRVQIDGKPNLTASRSFRITVEPRELPQLKPQTPTQPPTADVAASNTTTFVEFVPTSQNVAQRWRHTTEAPEEQGNRRWHQIGYRDASWPEADGGFGEGVVEGAARIRTVWSTPQIWLRREFELTESILIDPHVMIFHDDDAEVFINGTRVLNRPGSMSAYLPLRLDRNGRQTLRWGRNLLAVTCTHSDGSRYIDVGLATRRLPLSTVQQTALESAGKALRDLDSMLLITSDNAMAVLRMEGYSAEPPALVFQHTQRAAEAAHFRVGGVISIGRNFSDPDMVAMSESSAFRVLDSLLLEKCHVARGVFERFPEVPNLRLLVLKGTKWPKSAAKNLSRLTQLLTLDLSQTSITDEELPLLADLRQLTQLDLSNTAVTDDGIAELSALTKLKELGVFGTSVTVEGARRALPHADIRGAVSR